MTFTGIPTAALDFYEDLEIDNTKAFWSAHKHVYDEAVKAPLEALAARAGAGVRSTQVLPALSRRPLRERQDAVQDPSGRLVRRVVALPAHRGRRPVHRRRVLGHVLSAGRAAASRGGRRRSRGRAGTRDRGGAQVGPGPGWAPAHPGTERISQGSPAGRAAAIQVTDGAQGVRLTGVAVDQAGPNRDRQGPARGDPAGELARHPPRPRLITPAAAGRKNDPALSDRARPPLHLSPRRPRPPNPAGTGCLRVKDDPVCLR